MERERTLQKRIKALVLFFILGLVLSGATAIPLESELDWLVHASDASRASDSGKVWAVGLTKVQSAIHEVRVSNPFLFYGTDWLAFGHFMIAIAFIGVLRNPVRNRWLFDFGILACVLVIPYALIFGAIRGIPLWWRLIDCSFGAVGSIPLWFCQRWTRELEVMHRVSQGDAEVAASNRVARSE